MAAHYLYGLKNDRRKLVATFGSEAQLLAYVRWATLREDPDGRRAFEQGSALAGHQHWEHSSEPLTEESADEVLFNPTPNML